MFCSSWRRQGRRLLLFVLRPSKAEAGDVQVPQALSINQRDLPAAQAAFADTFRARCWANRCRCPETTKPYAVN